MSGAPARDGRPREPWRTRVLRLIGAAAVVGLVGCAGQADPPASSMTPTVPRPTTPTAAPTGTAAPPAQPLELPAVVASDLAVPWGLAFLPDGSALVTVRDTAEVLRVGLDRAPVSLGRVPEVTPDGEGGLLGIAVSPDVAQDRTAFVYATTAQDNRVLELRLDDGRDPSSFEVRRAILEGIPSAWNHDGGRIAFGPDGFLYVATGDAGEPARAQDLDSLGGKILRITPGGEPAPGNPWPGSPVWSYGHRNVQGLGWDARGRMFASEFGQDAWDELNRIEPGGNYGWPRVEGRAGVASFVDPLVQWRPSEASPSGIAVVDGAVYLAGLRGEALWRVPLSGEGIGEPERLLAGELGRLRAVVPDAVGGLWLLTSNRSGPGRPRPGDDRIVVVDAGAPDASSLG